MKRYSLQSYKGIATRHTCPSCGDKRPLSIMWTRRIHLCIRQSEDATTKAAAGIITLPSNTFRIIPNAVPLMLLLLMGK
mgnify:CR=1 FL=1